ncbi:metal-dependent transcriptional regulator [Peptostreptococcus sp. MV1]|uniref:metal-dependent transcriptional regulator n=1 Tax=Peptostreptococcus sp. MV1 TaxID=1219626 RepID=UPI0009FEE660|nr:MarR family transcriptional regulator [Peptostreptococcus sp. MV1]
MLHRKVFYKEHYIEVIYILLQDKDKVFNKDIVKYTKLSKPSVSVAVNNLVDEGYVYREFRSIKLTEKGEKIGKELYSRHLYFYNFHKLQYQFVHFFATLAKISALVLKYMSRLGLAYSF